MAKYVTKKAWHDFEDYWPADFMTMMVFEEEGGYVDTGLLDDKGDPIYKDCRMDQIGFIRSED